FELARSNAAAFSMDSKILATVDLPQQKLIKLADGGTRSDFRESDTVIHLVDSRTGKELRRIVIQKSSLIEAVAFSPDGKTLSVGTGWERREIHLYNVGDGREDQTIATPAGSHGSLALSFTPDGNRLVARMSDTSILMWDVRRMP